MLVLLPVASNCNENNISKIPNNVSYLKDVHKSNDKWEYPHYFHVNLMPSRDHRELSLSAHSSNIDTIREHKFTVLDTVFDKILIYLMEYGHFPSLSACIVVENDMVWDQAYGFSDLFCLFRLFVLYT